MLQPKGFLLLALPDEIFSQIFYSLPILYSVFPTGPLNVFCSSRVEPLCVWIQALCFFILLCYSSNYNFRALCRSVISFSSPFWFPSYKFSFPILLHYILLLFPVYGISCCFFSSVQFLVD